MSISGNAIKISVTAWDTVNNVGKTGLAASTFALESCADGASISAITSSGNINEDGNGEYFVALTAGQNTGTMMNVRGSNSGTGIVVIPHKWNNLPASGKMPETNNTSLLTFNVVSITTWLSALGIGVNNYYPVGLLNGQPLYTYGTSQADAASRYAGGGSLYWVAWNGTNWVSWYGLPAGISSPTGTGPSTAGTPAGSYTGSSGGTVTSNTLSPPLVISSILNANTTQIGGTNQTPGDIYGLLSDATNGLAAIKTAVGLTTLASVWTPTRAGYVDLLADSGFGLAKLVRSTTPANTLTVDANHLVAVPTTQVMTLPTMPTNWFTAAGVQADAVTKIQNGLATPTNITTVTNLTNLPAIPANWLTSTGIAASALNGKGDWSTATALTSGIQSIINNIQLNTTSTRRCIIALPGEFYIPDSGYSLFMLDMQLQDENETPIDPDSNTVSCFCQQTDGTNITFRLCQSLSSTTPDGPSDGSAKTLTRVATGRYQAYPMVLSSDGEQPIFFNGSYNASATAWVTSTSYTVGNQVSNGGNNYECLIANTSGTFATDLAAGKWVSLGTVTKNFSGVVDLRKLTPQATLTAILASADAAARPGAKMDIVDSPSSTGLGILAAAVRDVDNQTPATNSLGATSLDIKTSLTSGTAKVILGSNGLDLIDVTPVSGPATSFKNMLVQLYRRFGRQAILNKNTNILQTFADDNVTVLTTQTVTDVDGVQTQSGMS